MLSENLISDRPYYDGLNIFVYKNYAIRILKIIHMFLFFSICLKKFMFSFKFTFLIFLYSYITCFFFLFLSWISTIKFIRKIILLGLIDDEEVKPSILSKVLPETIFSIVNFFLYIILYIGHILCYLKIEDNHFHIPKEASILYFIYFFCCISYSILFNYENSINILLLSLNCLTTLSLYTFKDKISFLPSFIFSGIFLIYRCFHFNKHLIYYYDDEKRYAKYIIYDCLFAFLTFFLIHYNLIIIELFGCLILFSYLIFFYMDFHLEKLENYYDSMENRIILKYVSSFEENKKIPGILN